MTSVRWMLYDLKLSYIHTETAHSTTTNLSTLAVYTLIQVVKYTYDILVCNRRERMRERERETERLRIYVHWDVRKGRKSNHGTPHSRPTFRTEAVVLYVVSHESIRCVCASSNPFFLYSFFLFFYPMPRFHCYILGSALSVSANA